MSTLADFRDVSRRLAEGSERLAEAAAPLDVPPPGELEWFRTLRDKLLPQLGGRATLVVAVVGGTNIGKSVVFNHICGEKVSSSAPTAAGTKHPTVAVPQSGADPEVLGRLFPGFVLRQWADESDPIGASDEDLMFWKVSPTVPENLVVLDTPDVDSTMRVNWDRADKVRRSADLLVAVLTQQKYNDRAVRDFFTKAAEEGQAVAVVFNQIQIPEDETYWPEWVGTFCEETGIAPELVYLAPLDRQAANRLELPFYERSWPADDSQAGDREPHDLLEDLSELHFGAMKLRALEGGLRQVSEDVPDWLRLLKQKSEELSRTLVPAEDPIRSWPALPGPLMTREVREWWAAQRTGWTRGVQNFYGTIGDGLTGGWNMIRSAAGNPPADHWTEYTRREWEDGVWPLVEQRFALLERWQSEGSEGVRDRVSAALRGVDREQLRRTLKDEHAAADLQQELDRVVNEEMARFRVENESAHAMLKKLDTIAAGIRPLISVGLFAAGAGPLVEVGIAGTAVNAAADVTGGAVVTVVGEKVLGEGAGMAVGKLQDWYNNLHARFVQTRVEWVEKRLRELLEGELPRLLSEAAAVTEHPAYAEVRDAAEEIASRLAEN